MIEQKQTISFQKKDRQYRNFKTWTEDDDRKLLALADLHHFKWKKVAADFKDRNQNQCLHRYRRIKLNSVCKKLWSKTDDQRILELVNKHGRKWGSIAKEFRKRSGKQIRQRYINILDPGINREPWSDEQDQLIIKLYNQKGSKWNEISKHLKNRPENLVKNRFYSHILRFYQKLEQHLKKDENLINKKEELEDSQPTPQYKIQSKLERIESVQKEDQPRSICFFVPSNVMNADGNIPTIVLVPFVKSSDDNLMPFDQPCFQNKTSFFRNEQQRQ